MLQKDSRFASQVAALPNGDALYSPLTNVVSRIEKTGKVSVFIDLKLEVRDIRVMHDDVFVLTFDKIFKLDKNGRKMKSLHVCDVVAFTFLPDGKIAAIDRNSKMQVMQANDFRILNKDLKIGISRKTTDPSRTAITADKYSRIIRAHSANICIIELRANKAKPLEGYGFQYHGGIICAVDIDDSGNLWIGRGCGEVIVTKYYQSD